MDVKNTLRNVLIKKGFLYQNTLMRSMPNYCKSYDTMSAYQTYYILKKLDFATWKRKAMLEWINAKRGVLGLHES